LHRTPEPDHCCCTAASSRSGRRCGKASCRCVSGDSHESPAYTDAGRTKTVTLSEAEVPEVSAAVARYEAARAELEAAALAGVAALRARRAAQDQQG
jgi:hypothetical protein